MPLSTLIALSALLILFYMTVAWLVSLWLRNASIVDVLWGPGFVLLTWFWAFRLDGFSGRQLLLAALVTIWGVRLAAHIFLRNAGKAEDYRYARWREQAGSRWWWLSYFKVFLLQGAVMWIVSIPLIAALHSPTPAALTLLDYIGTALWLIGFAFEAIGDAQLARFKADPANKGKLFDRGLWRYTRHPNYFGEALLWWGYAAIALAVGAWWTLFSPALMTFLLLRVSGVAMLEKDLADSKPGYRDYIRCTSPFLPLPPKR
jgi:steroid 5-alpha reductase family enzyme